MRPLRSLRVIPVVLVVGLLSASLAPGAAVADEHPERHGAEFRVGAAAVDITPPLGIQMAGYNSTGRPATGVLDPLYAQALVFDDGRRSVALVTLDLIFTLLDPEMNAIRATVTSRHGDGHSQRRCVTFRC